MIQKVFNRRILALGILVTVAGVYLIVKLGTLHFSGRISLPPKSDRHEFVRRGYIKDRSGDIIAASIECRSLYANPQEIKNPEDAAVKISRALGLSEEYVLSRLARTGKRFVWIKRKLGEDELARVTDLSIPGIYFKREYTRVYPHGSLAAHLIGFVDSDNEGLEGLEYKYDDVLTTYTNEVLSSNDSDFRAGHSIVLTIDRVIQYTAEKELQAVIESSGARQGAVLITESRSGRILAFAKYPTFDPVNYSSATPFERSFFTVTEPYEPGSTMKAFSVSAYLTAKPGSTESFTCNGSVDIADAHINCTGVHGRINIADAIKYSCNVGIISSMRSVTSASWYSFLRAFGFGERTGTEIAGESPGILRELKGWSGLSKYSTAIGQEISVTSLQLAAAYGAIANDGVYYAPYVVEEIVDDHGDLVYHPKRPPKGRVIPEKLARELKRMLLRVVEGGTGKNAALAYYHVGGKTGTAQKAFKGSYAKDRNISSFAGLVPIDNPDLCIVVIIDEPKGVTAGSIIAAPVFAKIASRVLPYRGIGPSRTGHYDLSPSRPFAYTLNDTLLPDFTGRTLPDALKIVAAIQEKNPIHISVEGKGVVYRQTPAAGSNLQPNDNLVLYLRERNE
ncbi:MAG TPA: penicillin-binding transpeptidase domain-containing protein [Spirochaetota bacterium]